MADEDIALQELARIEPLYAKEKEKAKKALALSGEMLELLSMINQLEHAPGISCLRELFLERYLELKHGQ